MAKYDRGEIVLRAMVVGLVLAYSWLAAYSLEPRVQVPEEYFEYVVWMEGGRAYSLDEARSFRPVETARIVSELSMLEPELRFLGGLNSPLDFVIHQSPSRHFHSSETRVELGRDLAVEKGQVAKAVYKAWIQRNLDARISGSLVLNEVVSDALYFMLRGRFDVGGVGSSEGLQLPKTGNWLAFASSYQTSCKSEWASPELAGRCGDSPAMSPIGFRPLLVAMIRDVYVSQPRLSRLEFAKAWIEALKNPVRKSEARADSEVLAEGPSYLVDWRDWLRTQFEVVMPIEDLVHGGRIPSPNDRDALLSAYRRALESARLEEDQDPRVDYVVHAPSAERGASAVESSERSAKSDARQPLALVVDSRKFRSAESSPDDFADRVASSRLQPGGVEIFDRTRIESKYSIWSDCEVPKIGEVLEMAGKSRKILFIHSCGEPGEEVPKLLEEGPHAYLARQPEVSFVSLNAWSLRLAVRRGILRGDQSLARLMTRETQTPDALALLGFGNVEFDPRTKAYRLLGPIEAVEMFRSNMPQRF